MTTFILREIDEKSFQDIYRFDKKPDDKEVEKICIDYIKYSWLSYMPDRLGFEVVKVDRSGPYIDITFNSSLLSDNENGHQFDYENVTIEFRLDSEHVCKTGWLVQLTK